MSPSRATGEGAFRALWDTLLPIGRDPGTGGYLRYAWSATDLACREWFTAQAAARGLAVETDRNGNLWAWLGDPAATDRAEEAGDVGDAVVTGSHLDSVPYGGAYDGPLGIVCGLLALDALRERGARPVRPIGLAAFVEEEGSRFGVACLGSRLLTGSLSPDRARALRDRDGVTLAEAMAGAGADPAALGPELDRLRRVAAFVELHVEQGRGLAELGAPVGVAGAIWPHGRWRFDFTGEGNHAGTTRMSDRRDPLLTLAHTVLAANDEARRRGAHATVGRVSAQPNATNAIAAHASAWLDARAADEDTLRALVAAVQARAGEHAEMDRTAVSVTEESATPAVGFDPGLRDRLVKALGSEALGSEALGSEALGSAPVLPTGAGHDAGVLSAHVPAAMLFVRNPTGVSHSPAEHATDADCAAGVAALADVLEELACR